MAERYRSRSKTQDKKFKLGSASLEHELVNEDGTMWTGELYMGGNVLMDVVYDTGSDWLVIEGSDCTDCEGNKYDTNDSSGDPVRLTNSISERNYGSASLTGREWTDKVCLRPETNCIDDFEFFLISTQVGIREPIDGILGLSRNHPLWLM